MYFDNINIHLSKYTIVWNLQEYEQEVLLANTDN